MQKTILLAMAAHAAARDNMRLLATARILNVIFRRVILSNENYVKNAYFKVLLRCNALDRILREANNKAFLSNDATSFVLGLAFLQTNQIAQAEYYLEKMIAQNRSNHWREYRLLGRCAAIRGDYEMAAQLLQKSVNIYPPSVMAHQNYAARYDIDHYKPQLWELEEAGQLLIYDTLAQQAEDLIGLRGRFQEGMEVYAHMLAYQDKIAQGKKLPSGLKKRLASLSPHFNPELPTRILGYEWVTQIGHLGSLSAYLKRTLLGEVPPANHVLLAPKGKVCNQAALACYDHLLTIVQGEELVNKLFPYQRYFGESFMATRGPDGPEYWTQAAARAYMQWDHEERPPLLQLDMQDYAPERAALGRLGLPDGAWYVGLHVRDGGFYQEGQSAANAYRSADIEDYFDAIREITARGGYVIRLGDKSMRKIPRMEHVIDYPHTRLKSDRMDVFLFATSRFIIGTTSGLTGMAQAFGTPMLLINCLSSDWQFWHAKTDFMTKRLWSCAEKRHLSLGETFRQPLQAALVKSYLIKRMGYEPHPNSPQEILAAVRYKLDVLEGKRRRVDESHPLMQRYRQEIMHAPGLFGAAFPALPFLEAEFGDAAITSRDAA